MRQELRRLRGGLAALRDSPVTAVSPFPVPCHPPAHAVQQQPRGKGATPTTTGLCPALHRVLHCQRPPPGTGTRGPGNGHGNSVERDVSALRLKDRWDRQRLPGPAGVETQQDRPLCPAGGGSPAPEHQCNPPGLAAAPPRRRRSSKALWWRPLLPRPVSAGNRPRRVRGRGRSTVSGSSTARAGQRPLRTHRGAVPTTKMAPGRRGDSAAFAHASRDSPSAGSAPRMRSTPAAPAQDGGGGAGEAEVGRRRWQTQRCPVPAAPGLTPR